MIQNKYPSPSQLLLSCVFSLTGLWLQSHSPRRVGGSLWSQRKCYKCLCPGSDLMSRHYNYSRHGYYHITRLTAHKDHILVYSSCSVLALLCRIQARGRQRPPRMKNTLTIRKLRK